MVVVRPVRERAGAVVAAPAVVVVRWWLRGGVRPTEAVRGGVRPTETQRLGVTPTRGAHLPERDRRREEGVAGWAEKGREGRFSLFLL